MARFGICIIVTWLLISSSPGDRYTSSAMGDDAPNLARDVAQSNRKDTHRIDGESPDPTRRQFTGTLKGRFVFDGEPPKPELLRLPETPDRKGKLVTTLETEYYRPMKLSDESLLVGPDRGIQNIVIWLRDKQAPISPAHLEQAESSAPLTMTLSNGRLQPHIVAWWAGSRLVRFKNDDPFAINLRWNPLQSESFNHIFRSKESFERNVKTGNDFPAAVTSDILPWMQPAYLFPCDHPYVAVTDAEGYFILNGLPTGEWEFSVWHERCGRIKTAAWPKGNFTSQIGNGERDLGSIVLSPDLFNVQNRVPGNASQAKKPSDTWKTLGPQRQKEHDAESAKEWVGNWRMILPKGFEYDVALTATPEGLLKLDAKQKLNLRGTFALDKKQQLLLVQPTEDNIDDFIWQLNDRGHFVLIHEAHHVGSHYVGAILVRKAAQ